MNNEKMANDFNLREACRRFYRIFQKRISLAEETKEVAAGSYTSITTRAKNAFGVLVAASETMAQSAVSDLRMQVAAIHGRLDGMAEPYQVVGTIQSYHRYRVLFDDGSELSLDELIAED